MDIVDLIEKTEADNEAELVEALEEAGLSEDAVKAATVMARALNGVRDEIGEDEFIQIGKSLDYGFEVVEGEEDAGEDNDDAPTKIDKSELSSEMREYVEKLENETDRVEDLEKTVAELQEDAVLEGFIEKAESYSNLTASAEELGALLKDANEHLEDENVELLERLLKSSHALIEDNDLELETEKGQEGDGNPDALARLESIAVEKREEDPDLSEEQAFAKAAQENPKLYTDYKSGK